MKATPIVPPSVFTAAAVAGFALSAALFPASAQIAPTPPPPAAAPAGSETVQMSVFEVSTDKDIGYRAVSSIAGSRTGEDLRNVPMPITVLTEEFLRDIDATDLLEAARFSTGGRGMPTDDNDQQAFQFRGFRSQYQTRNLFVWQAPADAYNIERIDIAKGPNALLFGSSEPGGVANFNTKRAHFAAKTALGLRVGSWDQYRATLDVNRQLTAKVAARLNLVHDSRQSWENWVGGTRQAAHLALTFRLGQNTTLRADGEVGRLERVQAISLPIDAFSAWNGTTPFVVSATAVPAGTARLSTATGNDYLVWDTLTSRYQNWRGYGQTNGSGQSPARPVKNPAIIPRGAQFTGPDKNQATDFHTFGGSLEHRVGRSLSLLASFNAQNITENLLRPNNSNVRRDPNPTRPDGTPNPYFGGHYMEMTWSDTRSHDLVYDFRLDAIYDWKPARWLSQRLFFTAGSTVGRSNSAALNLVRTNNPAAPSYNAAPNTIRRRVYFAAGDTALNSALGVPAADPVSGIATAFMPTGGKSRLWSDSTYAGLGAAGTYWGGLLRTNLGLRHDNNVNDIQSGVRDAATGLLNFTDPRRRVNSLKKFSPTLGGTLTPWKPLTVFFNFAKTFRAPGTTGTNPLGESTTLRLGEGREGGMRVELLEGRFYLTASAYDITQTGQNHSVAGVLTAMNSIWTDPVLNTLNPTFANRALTGGSNESQTLHATGYEIEAQANLTPAWTLTAGYGNNINRVGEQDVGTLGYVRANLPEWERLAASNPAVGASIAAEIAAIYDYIRDAAPGLVRGRSYRDTVNLFTRYSFRAGKLRGLTVGGGMSYRGPAALNSQMINGNVVTLWGSVFTEYEAMAAYAFRLGDRYRGRVQLNIRNLLDRQRYEEVNLSQTRYEAPRSYSLNTTLSF
jgi:outer membrane receptor protein involved in Fe transport